MGGEGGEDFVRGLRCGVLDFKVLEREVCF